MISEIAIQNFKSIQSLALKPGRVTVLIGENGSGKSNILEAIAFAGCAASEKLDNEFLYHRGIRVTEDTWMVSAFPQAEEETKKRRIEFSVKGAAEDQVFNCRVVSSRSKEDKSFLKWHVSFPVAMSEVDQALLDENFAKQVTLRLEEMAKHIKIELPTGQQSSKLHLALEQQLRAHLEPLFADMQLQVQKRKQLGELAGKLGLADFVIFAPENTVLRLSPTEGAIQPLGTRGQGLFRLLQSFKDDAFRDDLADLQSRLHLFGWFDKFIPSDDVATKQACLQIHDRWLADDKATFDQRSANEGFLYVLFYFALLISRRTPVFFAIDNIDTALNPRLCATLMEQIVELAKKHNKQLICTTHNPAILDGLNLKDDEQRLYAVRRDSEGHTVVRRVRAPEPQKKGELPVRLSEAFLRGIIGGLPDHF